MPCDVLFFLVGEIRDSSLQSMFVNEAYHSPYQDESPGTNPPAASPSFSQKKWQKWDCDSLTRTSTLLLVTIQSAFHPLFRLNDGERVRHLSLHIDLIQMEAGLPILQFSSKQAPTYSFIMALMLGLWAMAALCAACWPRGVVRMWCSSEPPINLCCEPDVDIRRLPGRPGTLRVCCVWPPYGTGCPLSAEAPSTGTTKPVVCWWILVDTTSILSTCLTTDGLRLTLF